MILQCVFVKEIKLEQNKESSGLKKAFSYSQVKYLMIIMIGILWGYNIFTTYFPSFLQKYEYISPSNASSITGMIPLIGVAGTIITGIIVNKIRKRKIFVLISILIMIVGIVGSIYSNNNILWIVFSGFIGIAFSSFSLLYQVMLMELPNINANVVSGGIAWVNGTNNILVFLTPFVFDAINQLYNMKIAFLFFVIINIISIVFAYKIVEQ